MTLSLNCDWMFHRINADGEMWGYDYPPTGMGLCVEATEPCATVADANRLDGFQMSRAVAAMVKEHCGDPYTTVWLGRGWKVDVRSDYPLWTTNG